MPLSGARASAATIRASDRQSSASTSMKIVPATPSPAVSPR